MFFFKAKQAVGQIVVVVVVVVDDQSHPLVEFL